MTDTVRPSFAPGDLIIVSASWLDTCGYGAWKGKPFKVVRFIDHGPGRGILEVETPSGSPWTVWLARGVEAYSAPVPAREAAGRALIHHMMQQPAQLQQAKAAPSQFGGIIAASERIPPQSGYRSFRFVVRPFNDGGQCKFACHKQYDDDMGGFGQGNYYKYREDAESDMRRRYSEEAPRMVPQPSQPQQARAARPSNAPALTPGAEPIPLETAEERNAATIRDAATFTTSIRNGGRMQTIHDMGTMAEAGASAIILERRLANGREGLVYAVTAEGRSALVPRAEWERAVNVALRLNCA